MAQKIGELLTALGFMDDGGFLARNQKRYYVFNTQSWIFEDQERLVQALKDNFEILATIQKDRSNYVLYIRRQSTQRRFDSSIYSLLL